MTSDYRDCLKRGAQGDQNGSCMACGTYGMGCSAPPTAVDILVQEIEKADHLSLFNSGTPLLRELMDRATELFQPYPAADQAHTMALMFGILIGEIDGNAVEMEKQGVIITLEERLRIFVATARAIAKATIADKVMGEMPTQGSQPS